MNGQTALNLLKNRLAQGNSPTTNEDDWYFEELQQAQHRLENSPVRPWFIISETEEENIILGESRVQLPTDFLAEIEYEALELYQDGVLKQQLSKNSYDDLKAEFGVTSGQPTHYAVLGRYIRLFPLPDASDYTLRMLYYKRDNAMALAVENEWLKNAPELIIGEAGMIVAGVKNNPASLAVFQKLRQEELDRLLREQTSRQTDNQDPNPED